MKPIASMPTEICGGSNDAYLQLTDTITNPGCDLPFALDAMRGGYASLIELAVPIPEPGVAVLFVSLGLGLTSLRRASRRA